MGGDQVQYNNTKNKEKFPSIVSNILGTIKRYHGTTRYLQNFQRNL